MLEPMGEAAASVIGPEPLGDEGFFLELRSLLESSARFWIALEVEGVSSASASGVGTLRGAGLLELS